MAQVFIPSVLGFNIFRLLFLGWAAFELWVNLRTWPAGTANRDQLSRFLIIGTMAVSLWLALFATSWHAADIAVARPVVFYLGLLLIAGGLLLRAYAVRTLGPYFVPEVAIQPDQQLMDQGPYKYVRHPAYTGVLLIVLGLGLALTNGLSLAIMLLLPALAFGFRMHIEEAALLAAFGDDYRRYMQRTKRLIPFVY